MQIRYGSERGKTKIDWLNSLHTFSFSHYYDPEFMGFGSLRVINDDQVMPGAGFEPHKHHDMEIISYVLEGSLQHEDSLNHGSVIIPGDVQRMSAGTGITHSEFNPSTAETLHFLQVWVLPDQLNYPPSYEQKHFDADKKRGKFCLIASQDGREHSVSLHQDILIYAGLFSNSDRTRYTVASNRQVWIHIARGTIDVNQKTLHAGDGAALSSNETAVFENAVNAEVLLFDMVK